MQGRKVTLRLNNNVVEKAKNLNINLSGFLEVKLVEYMSIVNGTPRERFELPRGRVLTSSPSSRRSGLGHLGIKKVILKSFKIFSRLGDKFLFSSKLY